MADIYTYYLELNGENVLAGTLFIHQKHGRESASFEYSKEWLSRSERLALAPSLPFTPGAFYTSSPLFGVFADSAPDSWGRLLMRRFESEQAKAEGRTVKKLTEGDYLLRVCDFTRQGAMRFKTNRDSVFMSPISENSVPPLKNINQLLVASDRVLANKESLDDLKLLIDPGSSLGGARPKSAVLDNDGGLAIAKFPQKNDRYNQVIWEHITLLLAQKAGINTAQHRLENVSDREVLIVKRFDRDGEKRIHFLSAMSMLGAQDHEEHNYLELASAIKQHSVQPKTDLEELWRRIVFGILVSNSDDHLRNHGFLYQDSGWILSPAYDINPNVEQKDIHRTTLTATSGAKTTEEALEICEHFMLKQRRAEEILSEVKAAVIQWQNMAEAFGVKHEIKHLEGAFKV